MKECWQRFENWLAIYAPNLIEALNPGASVDEIDELQKVIGKKLPNDFIEFYMIHDGQQFKTGNLVDCEALLSIEHIIYNWKSWKESLDDKHFEESGVPFTSEPEVGIKNNWWNPLWIPFVEDGSGYFICIDLDPSTDGKNGQIIRMRHDSSLRNILGSSFSEWILNYVSELEAGVYVYTKQWGIVHKDSVFNKP
jgi:cell wall assembly regulator SMI1